MRGWTLVWSCLVACGEVGPAAEPVGEPVGEAAGEAAVEEASGVELSAPPLSMDIVVDARDSRSGVLTMTATYRGVDRPLVLKHIVEDQSYGFEDPTLVGSEGSIRRKGARYTLPASARGDVTVRWRVRPGGQGRHGAQGWADDRFTVFDGRALLLPISAQPVAAARFRFELPEGWSPATALTPDPDGWWSADPPSGGALLERLMKECHAAGPFLRADTTLGRTELRAFVHEDLDAELQARIVEDTRAIGGWFYEQVGYDPGHPLAFVRTPSGRGKRVFGGASMMGACYEGRYNDEPDRNTYLLGHRIGHPMNKYPPDGMTPAGPDEHWYVEGWASWAEVAAAEGSGRMPAGTYFPHLWRAHLDYTTKNPSFGSTRLYDESRAQGELVEYLHYFRSPLVVQSLAWFIEQRSDQTLETFSKHHWQEVGRHRRRYRLQQELEAFTGARFDDVWAAWVDGGLPIVPSFDGIIDAWARDRAARPSAAISGEARIHADDLRHLAASGRYPTFASVAEVFAMEGPTRAALRARGVQLVPDAVLAQVHGLDPATREQLVHAEAAWPVHTIAEPIRDLSPALRWLDTPDAAAWQQILATEAGDADRALAGGIDRIAVRVGGKKTAEERPDVLVVPPDAPFTVYVWWREPRASMRLEVLHGEAVVWSADVVEEPGWVRNRLVVGVADRPATPGVITVRVRAADGEMLGERRFWQR